MTNEQRRQALAKARANALEYAKCADKAFDRHGEDGPEVNLAVMWAAVAEAMKDGSPTRDSVDGTPASPATWDHWDGTTTR